jgi:hypothetical protein
MMKRLTRFCIRRERTCHTSRELEWAAWRGITVNSSACTKFIILSSLLIWRSLTVRVAIGRCYNLSLARRSVLCSIFSGVTHWGLRGLEEAVRALPREAGKDARQETGFAKAVADSKTVWRQMNIAQGTGGQHWTRLWPKTTTPQQFTDLLLKIWRFVLTADTSLIRYWPRNTSRRMNVKPFFSERNPDVLSTSDKYACSVQGRQSCKG